MIDKKTVYLFLFVFCFLIYANIINNAFILDDDVPAILNNPKICQFSNFWFQPSELLNSLCYLAVGEQTFAYHVISIVLHSINTVLVFWFLGYFFNFYASFLGACLFAAHPVHVEAVAWVSGKPYLFLAFFTLTIYFLYNRATDARKGEGGNRFGLFWYILALSIFAYSIVGANFFLLFLPAFLALSDMCFGKWRKNWIWLLPFFGIAVIRLFLLVQGLFPERISFMKIAINTTIEKNPLVYIVYSFFSHLWLLIFPLRLNLSRGPIGIASTIDNLGLLFIIPFLLIVLLLFFTFLKSRRLFFALSLFILFISPTFAPFSVTSSFIAERYLYLPSISMSMVGAFIYERYAERNEKLKKIILPLFVLIIFIFGIRTILRNYDWRNSEILFNKSLKLSPRNVDLRNKLGVIYFEKGDTLKAIEEFQKVISINPRYAGAYDNLAVAYMRIGKEIEALSFWNKALEIDPGYGQVHYNLSLYYLNMEQYELAIQHCDEADKLGFKLSPEFLESLKAYRK